MPEWLIGLLIAAGASVGVTVLCAVVAKVFPKRETYAKIKPAIIGASKVLSLALGRWIGKGNADKVEESIGKTLQYIIVNSTNDFFNTMYDVPYDPMGDTRIEDRGTNETGR